MTTRSQSATTMVDCSICRHSDEDPTWTAMFAQRVLGSQFRRERQSVVWQSCTSHAVESGRNLAGCPRCWTVSWGSQCFGLGRAGSAGVGKDGEMGRRTVIKWQNFLSVIVAGFHETIQTNPAITQTLSPAPIILLAFVLSFDHVIFGRSQGQGESRLLFGNVPT